jgi:hypothetical protein
VKRAEWGENRLEGHLSEVMRQLGEAFARAGKPHGSSNVSAAAVAAATPKLSPAGLHLLQV